VIASELRAIYSSAMLRLRRRSFLLGASALATSLAAISCGGEAPKPSGTPPPSPPIVRCPVCGDPIPPERFVLVGEGDAARKVCSNGCAIRLRESPEKFGAK
jgi:hypothetical protein